MKKWFAIALVAVALPACSYWTNDKIIPEYGFYQDAPLQTNVASLEVINAAKTPQRAPYIDHLLAVQLPDAIEEWAIHRIDPVGETGTIKVTIQKAGITETALPRTKGMKSWVVIDDVARYSGELEVLIEVYQPRMGLRRNRVITVDRSVTVDELASPMIREGKVISLIENLVGDMNRQVERFLRRDLKVSRLTPGFRGDRQSSLFDM